MCVSARAHVHVHVNFFKIIYFYDVFQVTYMYYTGRLEVFNENFPAVSILNFFKNDLQSDCVLNFAHLM